MLLSVYFDKIFPSFNREFKFLFFRELQDYFKSWTVTKNVAHDETRQQSW